MDEFWRATPALLSGQLKVHVRLKKRAARGKKDAPAKKARYVDQLDGAW